MPVVEVPLHRSLLIRLLATSVVVAVCAIVATAWLTMHVTTQAIGREQVRSLSGDTDIYDTLLGYAATHHTWTGVGPTVTDLGRRTGRRVMLMTGNRQPIADSGGGPPLSTDRPSATVDPLHTGAASAGWPAGDIDPRATGPYLLTAAERAQLRRLADDVIRCMSTQGLTAQIVDGPSGRPSVRLLSGDAINLASSCRRSTYILLAPTVTETRALDQLTAATDTCLGLKRPETVKILPTFQAQFRDRTGPTQDEIDACVLREHRAQLNAFVAPPALLFVTSSGPATAKPTVKLSGANLLRIAGVTGLVLLLAVAVTVVVGIRLVRPLRTLARAVHRPAEHQDRVPVATRDEIGHLASALNDLTERRDLLEQQRKDMVSDVAHELRSPLTTIRSWLEAAQDGITPVDRQLLQVVLTEAVHLQHTVDDLRDLAAADAGTLRLHPQPTFVNDLLAQVLEAHRGPAEAAGVALAGEAAGDPELSVDPHRLRQIVGNLVSNAVRHTPSGGTVTVWSAVGDGLLTIRVSDTGEGVAPEDLPRLFDRFRRADASRNRTTGGSGLGLSIVRRLAEAHGGDVTADSELGRGSTFTVRLPVAGESFSPEPTTP
jgi:two-component system sensor histidine kinase BaeS